MKPKFNLSKERKRLKRRWDKGEVMSIHLLFQLIERQDKKLIKKLMEDINEFRNIAQYKHPQAKLIIHLCNDIKDILTKRAGKN